MRRFALCFSLLCALAFGQEVINPGSGSGSGGGGNLTPALGPLSGMPTTCVAGANCLLAYYPLTDGTGTVVHDAGPNGNNAAFDVGTPTWVTTKGLQNGGNSNVKIPTAVSLNAKTIVMAFTHTAFNPSGQASLLQGQQATGCTGLMFGGHFAPNSNYDQVNTNTFEAYGAQSNMPAIGTHVVIWEPAGTSGNPEMFWMDGIPSIVNYTGVGGTGTTPYQTSGYWDMFGNAAGISCTGSSTYMASTDTIYGAAFFNQYLTNGEAVAVTNYVISTLQGAGEYPPYINLGASSSTQQVGAFGTTGDVLLNDGDSEMSQLVIPNSSVFLNNSDATIYNDAIAGAVVEWKVVSAPVEIDQLATLTGRCLNIAWMGTNNYQFTNDTYTQTGQLLNRYASDRKRKSNCKVLMATMLDRSGTGGSTYAENLSSWMRQNWFNAGWDGIVDFQSNANMGASGANSNTNYFTDGLHTTTAAKRNILDFMIQRATNRFWGNNDFSNATTYTTGAPAATAITVASCASNTCTMTSTANPGAGTCVYITGMTPTGYNTNYPTTPPCWMVQTSSSSQFTYYNITTPTAGTGFGTVSWPLQKDADGAVILAGSAASPSFTLETCQGLPTSTEQPWVTRIMNQNTTSPWVITPTNSETIDGASSLTMPAASTGNYPVITLQAINSGASTGNCVWQRIQ